MNEYDKMIIKAEVAIMLISDGKFYDDYDQGISALRDLRALLEYAKSTNERKALYNALDKMGWPEIKAFQNELAVGQGIFEDAGGYFMRCIKRLFGVAPEEEVTTYTKATRALIQKSLDK